MLSCEEWKQFAIAKNLEYLGSGISRTCYALNRHTVLKIGAVSMTEYDDDCTVEARTWANASPKIKKHLAKVFCSGAGWLIMERADKTFGDALRSEGLSMYSVKAETTSETMRKKTGSRFIDLHAGNIGVFGDTLKLIDYAV